MKLGDTADPLKSAPASSRTIFLFGSGVSRPAGMPSVSDISGVVLAGALDGIPYKKSTEGPYWALPQVLGSAPTAELNLIKTVHERCTRYFSRCVNYEDVAYVIWQVSNEQTGNYENPAIVPFLGALRKLFRKAELPKVAEEASTYISCVVSSMLSRKAKLGHMQLLIDAAQPSRHGQIEIFTLNHDTVIEQELQQAKIEYTDGFKLITDTCAYYEPGLALADQSRVKLYKLHGSIDWHLYRPDPGSPLRELVGRPLNGDYQHTLDFSGKMQFSPEQHSQMLIGTFNKILEYSDGIFADFFYRFRASLRTSDHLIVSGYGFCDKGVNAAIVEWLTSSSDKRLVVIHKEPETVKKHARLAIQIILKRCSTQVKYIQRWFEEATLEEVRRVIER